MKILFNSIEKGRSGYNVGLSLGMPKLDSLVYGLQRRWVTTIAGSSGSGKSVLTLYSYIYIPFCQYMQDKSINVNFLLGLILIIIGVEMIIDLIKDEEKYFELNIFNMLLVSLSVSLDSFSTGLCLSAITNNYILSGTMFSICAASFTFLGLLIG